MKTKQQVSNTELLTCCLLLFLHYDWCSALGGPCVSVCPARARGPPSTPRGLGLVVRGSAPAWDPQDSVDHRGLGLVVSWDPQVSGPPRCLWTPGLPEGGCSDFGEHRCLVPRCRVGRKVHNKDGWLEGVWYCIDVSLRGFGTV